MFIDTLKNAGLTQVQAEVLDFLFKNGEYKASDLAKYIKRPRGVVYKGLDELIELELVEKYDAPNKISTFKPAHPSKLDSLLEKKERNLRKTKRSYEEILPDIVSTYNLSLNKPGVKFYEGEKGIKKVLNDTLKSKTIVYTFTDGESVRKHAENLNKGYYEQRVKLNIQKKLIVPDTEGNRKIYADRQDNITEVRFIKKEFYTFNSGMQIYDNKVSYQTLTDKSKIAVLVEDKDIYLMQKALFEFMWSHAIDYIHENNSETKLV